jgi:MFS family permease
VIERLAPRDLGRDFRWLWASATVSNLGDGVLLAAGPLLVTTVSNEPIAVAAAVFLQQLPWVLFGIPAGAIVDRVDRRRMTIGVNALRAVVLTVLAAAIFAGAANLAIVLSTMFILGTAEMFADNAGSALIATRVPKDRLGLANSRFIGSNILTNQLVGPPIGAVLFGLGMALPFGVDAVCALAGAVLVIRVTTTEVPREPTGPTHLRREIADGIRWLQRHPPVRTLALTIFVFNVTFWAAYSLYVLLARDRLGLDELGYGLLLTAGAVGGLIGSVAYPTLERRFSLATLMRGGLLLETVTHLILATTTSAIVVAATMLLFGVHTTVWGTTSSTVRQRAVPASLLGRVTSVYMLGSIGGASIGAVIGGILAQRFGITAPFWFGFIGSALMLALIWGTLSDIAHLPPAEEEDAVVAEGPALAT